MKITFALLMGLLLIAPVMAIDSATIDDYQNDMYIPHADATSSTGDRINSGITLTPGSPSSSPVKRGSGRIACTTAYASDGKKVFLRDVVVSKKYLSNGKTAVREVKVYGSKCKYKVNNRLIAMKMARSGQMMDNTVIEQRDVIFK